MGDNIHYTKYVAKGVENVSYLEDGLKLRHGNHVCIIYSIEHERRASILKFVAGALARHDMFLYVADASPESVLDWLKCAHRTEHVQVNDRLGHDQGNRLLQAFTVITREELRTAIDFTFRICGDEFAILMGDCTLEKTKLVCQRLDEQFCQQTEIASLAYGVVEIPKNLDKKEITANQSWLEHLMSIADERMYKHKISYKSSLRDASISEETI